MFYTFLPNPFITKNGKNVSEKVIEGIFLAENKEGLEDFILTYLSNCYSDMELNVSSLNGKPTYTFKVNHIIETLLPSTSAIQYHEFWKEPTALRQVTRRKQIRENLRSNVGERIPEFNPEFAKELHPLEVLNDIAPKLEEGQVEQLKKGYYNFSIQLPEEKYCKDLHNLRIVQYMEMRKNGYRNVFTSSKEVIKRGQRADNTSKGIPARTKEIPQRLFRTLWKIHSVDCKEDYFEGNRCLVTDTGLYKLWIQGLQYFMEYNNFKNDGDYIALVQAYASIDKIENKQTKEEIQDLLDIELLRRYQ